MDKKQWGPGRSLLIPAIACAVAGLAAYAQSGITEFTTSLAADAIAGYGIGIVLCVIGLFWNTKAVKCLGYVALLYGALKAIAVQGTYIVNVLVSIDGTSFSTGFIVTAAASLAAVILALLATVLRTEQKGVQA